MLMDGMDRVLFCRGVEPATGAVFWVIPGGGLDDGETFEEAARREVLEETGLEVEVGPCVWYRRHQHVWAGKNADQYERFHIARVPFPSEVNGARVDSYVTEMRWWTLDEMRAAEEETVFVPRRTVALLTDLLEGRWGGDPLDCGV
ncbi:MAG: NUDIX domain-containing protein [Verrucomicrobiaceae bacterium]|nr:MAG: NUDIX domain-containing protein [Verrucomicrobiaceae bacterium]